MATIRASQLIKLFKQALKEKWGYIWGASGETWTKAKQDAATRDMTVKYGSKWIGKRVADCSGLFSWAFKSLGGYMYHGSNTMWKKYCTKQGKLVNGKRDDGEVLKPGTAVFMCKKNTTDYYHVGLYVNDTSQKIEVIEAKGTYDGVVPSKVKTWTHWGELKGVTYDDVDNVVNSTDEVVEYNSLGQRTLKKTAPCMDGDDVKQLQTKLNALGYSCGSVDGLFGTKTESALKKFQSENKLVVDGIFGKASLAALNSAKTPDKVPDAEEEPAEPLQTYTVNKGDTLWRISQKFLGNGSKYKKIMTANGLKTTMIKPGMVLTIPAE